MYIYREILISVNRHVILLSSNPNSKDEIDYEFTVNMQIHVTLVHDSATTNVNQIRLINHSSLVGSLWNEFVKFNPGFNYANVLDFFSKVHYYDFSTNTLRVFKKKK